MKNTMKLKSIDIDASTIMKCLSMFTVLLSHMSDRLSMPIIFRGGGRTLRHRHGGFSISFWIWIRGILYSKRINRILG